MTHRVRMLVMCCACGLFGQLAASPVAMAQSPERPDWAAPPLPQSVSVRDGHTGQRLSLANMLDALAEAEVVFVGETHTDETTHRVEAAVLNGLLERRNGQVVLGLEMFERDVQPALDAYLAGEISESEFLDKARPWNNYRTAYRPLIEAAKGAKIPVLASNFPRPLLRRLASEGPQVLESLEGEAKRHSPEKLFPNSAEYWCRVDNAVRGHQMMMRQTDDPERLLSTQSLWDNSMGAACAEALDRYPGSIVVHVNGGFHSAYWDGTVHQLRQRKPDARIKTISIVPTANPAVEVVEGAAVADFVVFAEARAGDFNDGRWSVQVSRELNYQLHVPEHATRRKPVPLLVWLSDDGFTSQDGLDLWQQRVGSEAAIVVVEAPYRQLQEDLAVGGRWFWPDSFAADTATLVEGVERIWGYVARHYPIDSKRVCVAGEGTGATVAAGMALLSDRIDVRGVALVPRQYAKIRDFPLPLPEYWGDDQPPIKSLLVIGDQDVQNGWQSELDEYTKVGIESTFRSREADPWTRQRQTENALREALQLSPLAEDPSRPRRYLLVDSRLPRARHWARLQAQWLSRQLGADVAVVSETPTAAGEPISTEVVPQAFAAPHALPLCPGPFGGTTVVVLPADVPPAAQQAWLDLESDDPLARQSRFHRLRIATTGGQRGLVEVLEKLQTEGRNNVLIVPAAFAASGDWMRKLRDQVTALEDQMTLQWLPGLGGQEAALSMLTVDPADDPTPIRHRLSVQLHPDDHRLVVQDAIALPPSRNQAGTEFTLNSVLEMTSSEPAVEKVGPDGPANTRYRITAAAADGTLKLEYQGVVNFALSDQKEEYTRGFRETQGFIGPEGVYLDGDSTWVPTFGEAMVRFQLDVQLPEGWHAISQGAGTSRDSASRGSWDSETAMEQVYLVAGPLHMFRESAGAVELLVYLRESDEALARQYLETGARYMEMYRQLIGPYPYKKFAVVENFWETGYGMPSFTLLGPQVIRFPFILHSSYPHEILHNWWGNSVFVDYEHGNWCEGLTAYMADHLVQEQRGTGHEYRRNTLQKYRDYVQQEKDFPLSEFKSRHNAATEAVGYGKSLMLFHMLRRTVGDDVFREGLTRFYRDQRGKRAGFADLQTAFEAVSDQSWQSFFDQWVQGVGAPQLAVNDLTVRRDGDAMLIAGQLSQTQPGQPFQLDVPVLVQTETETRWFTVAMTGREQSFELRVAGRPWMLAVDPMFDVFRLLDPRETPASIGQIFGEPAILAVLPAAAPADVQQHYRDLMQAWQSEEHQIELVLDKDLKQLPENRSAWVLGAENRFAGTVLSDDNARTLQSQRSVTLDGQPVSSADHCLVIVQRHPANLSHAVGWIAVDPLDAFPGMARKLPHYGKYSYLAFEGSEPTNVVKGQWSTSGSPLVVDFRESPQQSTALSWDVAREALAELPPIFSERALLNHVQWLAASERQGRGLGSQGLEQSAQYIAEQMAAAGLQPGGDDGGWFQRLTVEQGPDGKPVETVNVIGVVPGQRSDWQDQSVVLSAHYDHLGFGWPDAHTDFRGQLHPGADDNASGVAVMLELARVFASEQTASRNLVCIAFSAEECGRLGSQYYVQNPRYPLGQLRGVINLDAVGRLHDGKLAIHGTGTADEWQHIFRGCSFVTGVPSQNVPQTVGGSDEVSFVEQGVPAVHVFSGAHQDYHRPSDTADKIDAAGLVKVATFLKEAVAYLLEREEPLTVRIEGSAASTATAPGGGRNVLFGTVPAFDFQGPGVRVDGLVADSPAEQAGVREGDVIVQLDDQPVADLRAFSDLLKKLKPGQEVAATVLRDGQRVQLRVKVVAR